MCSLVEDIVCWRGMVLVSWLLVVVSEVAQKTLISLSVGLMTYYGIQVTSDYACLYACVYCRVTYRYTSFACWKDTALESRLNGVLKVAPPTVSPTAILSGYIFKPENYSTSVKTRLEWPLICK